MWDWARWCRRALVAAGAVALVMGGVSIFGQPDREILYQPEPPLTVCGAHGCTFIYLGALATVLAYAAWGGLLQRYSAALVAPFALIAPCTGVLSSALIFDEAFSPTRYAGMALILGGLAVILLPTDRMSRLSRQGECSR